MMIRNEERAPARFPVPLAPTGRGARGGMLKSWSRGGAAFIAVSLRAFPGARVSFPPLVKGGPGGVDPARSVTREPSFSMSKAPAPPPRAPLHSPWRLCTPCPPPLAPPSQGGERDHSAALAFDRAQQKHPSPNRRSSPFNTDFSLPQGQGGCIPPVELHTSPRRGGFTLIELLVVITIILIISAIALPTILPALAHRQVSEAARILQGALVGARDSAIHNNVPSGIRLLPDPNLLSRVTNPTSPLLGQIDPTQPLAANRIIPIETAPEYSEGFVNVYPPTTIANTFSSLVPLTYPVTNPDGTTGVYPYPGTPANLATGATVLMIEESILDPKSFLPNSPTSWFWNIRVGDKIQINDAGPWYTVVGPMASTPANAGNTEMFVNVGPPGTRSPLVRNQGGNLVNPEFLFLVNGQDDKPQNGWIDEGWDGVDNNNNGYTDELAEWELETWHGSVVTQGVLNQPYSILRRPTPVINAREVSLPSNVVIDMTTWGYPFPTQANPKLTPSRERSRLPINSFTGYVDILVYPNGTVVPTTIYSTPASFGLAGSFFHFWLAERSDVVAPGTNSLNANPPYLPVPQGIAPALFASGAELKGEYRLVTLFTRTGQLVTNDNVPFDNPVNAQLQNRPYNANLPFLEAQQGIRGGP